MPISFPAISSLPFSHHVVEESGSRVLSFLRSEFFVDNVILKETRVAQVCNFQKGAFACVQVFYLGSGRGV